MTGLEKDILTRSTFDKLLFMLVASWAGWISYTVIAMGSNRFTQSDGEVMRDRITSIEIAQAKMDDPTELFNVEIIQMRREIQEFKMEYRTTTKDLTASVNAMAVAFAKLGNKGD